MENILLTRTHQIYDGRKAQLTRNLLAWRGGKPYIDVALTRYPCESDASWVGDATRGVVGRAGRTSYINYAGRIVAKINQYVFGQDVARNGIGEEFQDDATKSGMSITTLMEEACALLTVGGWCWLHADRGAPEIDPETMAPRPRSLAERERAGDRVFWQLWGPLDVVDWHFGADGDLAWLITEQKTYNNSDVETKPIEERLRTVWKRGSVRRIWYEGEKIRLDEEFPLSIERVPFVPLGIPSALPWWYDDVERIQGGLLNLESTHLESLAAAVFPQLVVPADMVSNLMGLLKVEGPDGMRMAMEMVRGLNYPILEPTESSGLTRYIMPDQGNLKVLPDEVMRRRRELFEVVGLAMANKETAQIASAESKAWDHLDPAAVMRSRAARLEEAERKMVDLSRELDSTFPEYEAVYPKTFAMVDFASDIKAVVELDQAVTASSLRRELERVKAKLVAQRFGVPPERMDEIGEEIDGGDFSMPKLETGFSDDVD